jgi:hypothetical protein
MSAGSVTGKKHAGKPCAESEVTDLSSHNILHFVHPVILFYDFGGVYEQP